METYKQAPVIGSRRVDESAEGSRAKVYFTRVIDAAHLISLYARINDAIYGKVAIKLHTGEKHGPNILPRDMVSQVRCLPRADRPAPRARKPRLSLRTLADDRERPPNRRSRVTDV